MSLAGTNVAVVFDAACDARFNPVEILDPSNDIFPAACGVAAALRRAGAAATLVPIFRELERSLGQLRVLEPDVVFNLCESFNGFSSGEAAIVSLLELLGMPVTGSPAAPLLLCLQKQVAKDVLSARGVRTPRGAVVDPSGAHLPRLEFPLIVKPAQEDASIGLAFDSIVTDADALRERVRRLYREVESPVLVEEYVDGREFNVAVVGRDALPISEIDFASLPDDRPRLVTHAGKWDEASADYRGTVPVCPARIPARLRDRLVTVARQCIDILGVRDYARVDFRLDGRDRLFVLEVNPNPDISADAGLARAAAAAGWSYDDLVVRLVLLARARLKAKPHAHRNIEATPSLRP